MDWCAVDQFAPAVDVVPAHRDRIVGGFGVAVESFNGKGKIWLEGETWTATSKQPVEKDQTVVVRNLRGLVLSVEPVTESESTGAEFQT